MGISHPVDPPPPPRTCMGGWWIGACHICMYVDEIPMSNLLWYACRGYNAALYGKGSTVHLHSYDRNLDM